MERKTRQKEVVIEVLKKDKTHPTIKELYSKVKTLDKTIGQATVYRCVNKLVKDGTFLKLDFRDGFHYDYNYHDHFHFYCLECKNIFDIYFSDYIIDKLLKTPNLFDFHVTNFVLEGVCKNCSK